MTIHHLLPVYPNVVMLHRASETFAFFLLEFVPSQDLFYFLEQARDHSDVNPTADPTLTHTLPSLGLLSSLHPSPPIASMFT
jgi:hypothetical protein